MPLQARKISTKSMTFTRADWKVLSHISLFEQTATAFGTCRFLQVTLLALLGLASGDKKTNPNDDGDLMETV